MNSKFVKILPLFLGSLGLFMLMINLFAEFNEPFIILITSFLLVIFTFRINDEDKMAKLHAHRISGYVLVLSLITLTTVQAIENEQISLPNWHLPIFIWITLWYGTFLLINFGIIKKFKNTSETTTKYDMLQKYLVGFVAVASIVTLFVI